MNCAGFLRFKMAKIILTLKQFLRRRWVAVDNYFKKKDWEDFSTENPHLIEYKKNYKSPTELVTKLIADGLKISSRKIAEDIIYNNNYYRFKAYFLPFFDKNGSFDSRTYFSQIYGLYLIDQKIRDFLFPIVAKLEIRIRANIDNLVTSETTDPFWHLNPAYFSKYEEVKRAMDKASSRFAAGKQEFALHYKKKYYTRASYDYKLTPPFWIISEILTVEQLLSVAKNINKEKFALSAGKNKLNDCAKNFGFDSYESLMTNLSCILEIRNLCAHHTRLWNRNLKNPSAISKKISVKISHPNRLYSHLVMLRIMCKHQNIEDGIKDFFKRAIDSNGTLKRDMNSMGFPEKWETDPFWS